MSNVLKHRFTSPKLDGSDATQVQPSAWNEGHQFSGGTDGQMLVRSTADATYGAAWATVAQPQVWTFVDTVLQPAPTIHHDIVWTFPGSANVRVSPASDGNVEITGIVPSSPAFEGKMLNLIFFANVPRYLRLHHYDSRSAAPNRFFLPGGAAFTVIGLAACVTLTYMAGNWWVTGALNAPGALLTDILTPLPAEGTP